MFLKKLTILNDANKVIRDIEFKSGLNLIIDDTPVSETKLTGNNVGKTTVLKLIDFCLGGKPSIIYTDTENKKDTYQLVKDYLIDNNIKVRLILKDNLFDDNSKEITIERNFLNKKKAIRCINGKDILEKDFNDELGKLIMPQLKAEKPTFRQVISHNIRYKDDSINNTLRTLDRYTSDAEYETLYLFLLGCTFDAGEKKQVLLTKLKQERLFKERLEKRQTKSAYEISLSILDDEIDVLNKKKSNFNLNENFANDLERLDVIKYNINRCSSIISNLKIRKNLIVESQIELNNSISNIDLEKLRILYTEASENISGIQKTFEDLVRYHNEMVLEKAKFIGIDLPNIECEIEKREKEISDLLTQEKILSEKISKGNSFEELEQIIAELNEKFRTKGEYENIIAQLNETDKNINKLNKDLNDIDDILFSNDFEEHLKKQIIKFNKYFSAISSELYGEKYALKYDHTINKKNQQIYKFNSFNANMSSGKKQGEILCFDLAYILFADNENIPCLHFLLNDKKELMHDNQLIKVAEFVKDCGIQLIISILKDKLPLSAIENAHIAVELSQTDKLFRIE